jgi:hypothetical protein
LSTCRTHRREGVGTPNHSARVRAKKQVQYVCADAVGGGEGERVGRGGVQWLGTPHPATHPSAPCMRRSEIWCSGATEATTRRWNRWCSWSHSSLARTSSSSAVPAPAPAAPPSPPALPPPSSPPPAAAPPSASRGFLLPRGLRSCAASRLGGMPGKYGAPASKGRYPSRHRYGMFTRNVFQSQSTLKNCASGD